MGAVENRGGQYDDRERGHRHADAFDQPSREHKEDAIVAQHGGNVVHVEYL
jgi:hypothetical protein